MLSLQDVETLLHLADYYERSMGRARHIVRLTAPPSVRSRFRYVAEERKYLRLFLSTVKDEMAQSERSHASVRFTLRSLVACWGRLLSSLNTRRSRRKLSDDQVQHRDLLAQKLAAAASVVLSNSPDKLESELETRRPREAEWMRLALRAGS